MTWIDKINPEIASLVWWVWESCTNETWFVITWIFDEEVVWVTINSLTWENINIISFNWTGNEYAWEVELLWWTWYVEIVIDWITDLIWNPFIDSTWLVIWVGGHSIWVTKRTL